MEKETVNLKRGLAFKLTFAVVAGVTIVFSIVFVYNYIFSRELIFNMIKDNAREVARSTSNKIAVTLKAIEKITQNVAQYVTEGGLTPEEIDRMLKVTVERNPEIFGASVSFEQDVPVDVNSVSWLKRKSIASYFYRSRGGVRKLSFPYYVYSNRDWYQITKHLKKPQWSEPYYGLGVNGVLMTTYCVPVFKNVNGEKIFWGVASSDVSLKWLQKLVNGIKMGRSGYGFIISSNGTFVTHPVFDLIMNETIFTIAAAKKDRRLRMIGRRMIHGESGLVEINGIVRNKKCWLVFEPLAVSGWSLGIVFSEDELLMEINWLNYVVAILGMAGFVAVYFIVGVISRSVTRPLRALARTTMEIARGNLDAEVPAIESKDEVGLLAESFKYMQSSLKKYIADLTHTVAAKERIERELQIAHDIQMGILPKTFPPFPEKGEFDIYATIKPAKEVGGDFYDFYFLDEHHFCVVVGDVSGKGVPASLFMAVTKTLTKAKASCDKDPGSILSEVNRDLAADNPSMMFVTLFLGILDLRSGRFVYASGGHTPPYVVKSNGGVQELETAKGIPLGVMENFKYSYKETFLEPGDLVIMYTDGVTEAANLKGELFSNKRLVDLLDGVSAESPRDMINSIMEKVENFSHGAPQADDITIMVLKFYGRR